MATETADGTADAETAGVLAQFKDIIGWRDDHNNLMGLLFVLPDVVVFAMFLFLPVAYALYLSFTDYSILSQEATWTGLENYVTVLTPLPWEQNWKAFSSPTFNTFWWSLKTTTVYAIGTVPFQIYGGLAVALMLDKRVRFKNSFRAAFFMPVMLSGAASAVIWRTLLSADGVINTILPTMLEHNWAGSTTFALPSVMLMAIWGGIGFNMVLFLAGLQTVPEQLYEAARIDGTNGWQRFRHVTWPNLDNTNFFVVVMAVIGAFQVFGIALIFSDGGPYYATTTTVLLIYQKAFEEGAFGAGAAMAFILFLIIFAFSYYQYQHRKSGEVDY